MTQMQWMALVAALTLGLVGGGCSGQLVTGDDDAADDDTADDDAADDDAADDDADDDDAADDDAADDDAADDDAGDDDAEIPPTPGFTWEVPSGPYAGSYTYDTSVFCDWFEGFPGVWAADDMQWNDMSGFTLWQEPGPGQHITGGYFVWSLGPVWIEANAGPDCYLDTVQGWPHVTGTFQCQAMASEDGGPPTPVDVIHGAFRCP